MSDKLIYGKNSKTNIVSIEADDGVLEIFTENSYGVQSEIISNKYWALTSEKFHKNLIKLDGDLHYKYGIQFEKWEDYTDFYQTYRKKDIYRIFDAKEASMVNKGITYFKGMNVADVSVLSFDIETTTLDPEEKNAQVILISNTYRKNNKIERKLFSYDEYENEGEMIDDWCNWVKLKDPSVLLGHNIFCFDLPYLYKRARKHDTLLNLGRNDSPAFFDRFEKKFRKEASQFIHYKDCKIYGREIIDTMFLSIRHDAASRKYESYGLKSIIKQEGLEKKDRQFYDANQIRFNFKNPKEFEKIKEYCKDDSDDALALYDLMIPPYFYLCQSIPKSFQSIIQSASGSQVNSMLVRSYLQDAHSIPKADEISDFTGALSWGNPGIYKNVLKWDVTSLYPSLIVTYQIYSKQKDPKAHFLKLVELFLEKRIEYKKKAKENEMYDHMQLAFKLLINSMYGACSASGLNFNYPNGAAEITRRGRELLEKSIVWATNKTFLDWKGDDNEESSDDFSEL